jgi:hypothetical protein
LMYVSSTGTPPAVVVGCVGLLSAVAAVAIIWPSTPLHSWQVRSVLDVLLQPTHQVTIFRHYLIGRGQLQSEQSISVYRDPTHTTAEERPHRWIFFLVCLSTHGAAAQCDKGPCVWWHGGLKRQVLACLLPHVLLLQLQEHLQVST